MISIFLKEITKKYNINPINKIWRSSIFPAFKRDVLIYGNFKFIEHVIFNNNFSKEAIMIGYNPSSVSNSSTMDQTNIKIAQLLMNNNYGGFYLLNLYPEINSQKVKVSITNYSDFYVIINTVLNQIINTHNFVSDIYFFWGRSVYLNKKIQNFINNGLVNYNLYCLTNSANNLHNHPSRIAFSNMGYKHILIPITKYLR